MSGEIQVSVIVPSYDHEPFVVAAVTSALEQEDVALEVIAIDDGSHDGSADRLEAIRDSRLRVLRQDNRGLSRTLNRGLCEARGRFVKMLPSDDLLEPGALAAQLDATEPGHRDLVFCLPTVVDAEDRPLEDPAPQSWFDVEGADARSILRQIVARNPLCAPSALFDRELALRVGGFDPSLRVAQDYDLWLRLLPRTEARIDAARRVRVRWHGDNQSAVPTSSTEDERAFALVGALVRNGLARWEGWFAPEGKAALAAALVASGLREARPFARAALVRARAAGEEVAGRPELRSLLDEAPELERQGAWGSVPGADEGWG